VAFSGEYSVTVFHNYQLVNKRAHDEETRRAVLLEQLCGIV
jgi:hypothetical protein